MWNTVYMFSVCIPVTSSGVEHIFMSFLPICISLVKDQFISVAHLKKLDCLSSYWAQSVYLKFNLKKNSNKQAKLTHFIDPHVVCNLTFSCEFLCGNFKGQGECVYLLGGSVFTSAWNSKMLQMWIQFQLSPPCSF